MTKSKSPGAVTAHGASEFDQLGSKVDPRNSPNNVAAQALSGSTAGRCLIRGCAIESRRVGRRRKYCCYPCRDEARTMRINSETDPECAPGATRRDALACQLSGVTISATPMLYVERSTTSDMPDGRPLPPDDGHVWCLVHRVDGVTLWRRIFVSSGADGARRRRTKERASQRKDHTNG